MNYMPKSRPIHSRPIIDLLCIFFLSFPSNFLCVYKRMSVLLSDLVFYLSNGPGFCYFFFLFIFVLLYEMIAKAWHKMPLAKSKLLVKVCQQNAIRFQFAFFFLSMALRLNSMHSTLLPIYNYRSHFCDTS